MFTSLMIGLGLVLMGALFGTGTQISIAEEFEEAIEDCAKDETREEAALAHMETVRAELNKHQAAIGGAMTDFAEVDARYDATLEDYRAVNASINKTWDNAMVYYFDQIVEMREILTTEEWAECVAIQDKKLDKEQKKTLKHLKKEQESLEEEAAELNEEEQQETEQEEKD